MARRRSAVAASASKVHPVAVVAKDVEGPVGRQRPRSCHEAKHNPLGRGRTRLEGGELDALAPLERGQVLGFGMTGASHPLENGRMVVANSPVLHLVALPVGVNDHVAGSQVVGDGVADASQVNRAH